MLYDLALEKLARGRSESPRRQLEELVEAGADNPEHLAEVLARKLAAGETGATLEEKGWLLGRLLELTEAGAELAREALLGATEDYMVEALRVRAPDELPTVRRALATGLAAPRGDRADHLGRMMDAARDAAGAGDAYLFQALLRYAARGLPRAGRGTRSVLLDFLTLYPIARGLRCQRRWADWLPGLMRSLTLALTAPQAQRLLAGEPELLTPALEPLARDFAIDCAEGHRERLDPIAKHLAALAGAHPHHPGLRGMSPWLERALALAPGGQDGEVARLLRQRLGPALAPAPAPARLPSRLESHLRGLGREVARRAAVRAALRPRPRQHMARYLRVAEHHGVADPALAAMYPESRHFPHPLVALYFPRGSSGAISRLDRGPVDLHLRKRRGTYRLSLFHQNRTELVSCHGFLEESATFTFRRSLTYSGGRYAVALIELETLEVGSVRLLDGYLDFTGAYYQGLEHMMAHDPQAAIRELEKALAANPRLAGPNLHLGRCYRMLARGKRDLRRARRCYERELVVRPDSADALNNLGLLALSEGELDEAVALLERATRADPEHLGALLNRALTCVALPRSPGSKDRFRELLKQVRDLDLEGDVLRRVLREEDGAFGEDWESVLRLEA